MIFAAAAIYNIAFGAWAVLWPNAFFIHFELGEPNHPWVWGCLGMVIGVYGLGYAYVAWRPRRGDVIVALGLIGKVLGPAGWLWTVHQGQISPRTFPLILGNDLIWWFPFAAYLLRDVEHRRRLLAWIVVLFHVTGSMALLSVRGGTEAELDLAARMGFIRSHQSAWTLCWFLWSCASLGLLAFFVVWAIRLREFGASWNVLLVGCACGAIGLGVDLTSEIVAVAIMTDQDASGSWFASHARRLTLLGAGIANGLYCIGGVALSAISWRVGFQRGFQAALAGAVWLSGLLLSAAAFANWPGLMVVAGALLMITFIVWAMITSFRLDDPRQSARA